MKKIAIVYDWFDKWGGVERVILTLKEIFPKAVFFTSYFDKKKAFWAQQFNIKSSFIQKLPSFIKRNRLFSLPFYPIAFETFDFSSYDLVISVSSSFAKGVIVKTPVKHVVYLLTPTRFLWVMPENYYLSGFKKNMISQYFNYLKKWDFIASKRADKIFSISKTVRQRCLKYYQRDCDVIYPPFDIEYWEKVKLKIKNQKSKIKIRSQRYFLVVSRLENYKKVDLLIKVFNKRKENLFVVGEGSEEKKLKKMASKNIIFLKKITDEELAYLYSNALALIMPQEEDFGYVSLESQFFGTPVLAYKKGGATETVLANKTGLFFEEQTEGLINKLINRFNKISSLLKRQTLKMGLANVKKFDKIYFTNQFKKIMI